ncbi:MAG: cysteine--tRNA ligase [Brevinemataceae bacterium]
MDIKLYNSLNKKLESLPSKTKLNIYSCGPTVYDFAHIGNLRTFLIEDLLIRTLKTISYDIHHVRNLTDIDDKIIQKAYQLQIPIEELTEKYSNLFFEDIQSLNFDQKSTTYIKATDYINQAIDIITQLINHQFAYETEDGVYFHTKAFKEYGNFSGLDLENIQEGAAGIIQEYQKKNDSDFVLWKKYKPEDYNSYWESPWGKGRPGWHTECASIVADQFPDGLDIHTGGVDLLFPHHTNEKAQIECLSSKPMSKIWMHITHLLVDNQKMSKSLGNFYTFHDLQELGFDARTVRFYLQTAAHYRSPLNFTLDGLRSAISSLKRVDNFIAIISENPSEGSCYSLKDNFLDKLCNDLNISAALGELFKIINDFFAGQAVDSKQMLSDLKEINRILGVFSFPEDNEITDKNILEIFNNRVEARKQKNWQESDRLRDLLWEHGVDVRDTKDGSTLIKRSHSS